jgi:hypothetical protein
MAVSKAYVDNAIANTGGGVGTVYMHNITISDGVNTIRFKMYNTSATPIDINGIRALAGKLSLNSGLITFPDSQGNSTTELMCISGFASDIDSIMITYSGGYMSIVMNTVTDTVSPLSDLN